jgi:hypothetical protein
MAHTHAFFIVQGVTFLQAPEVVAARAYVRTGQLDDVLWFKLPVFMSNRGSSGGTGRFRTLCPSPCLPHVRAQFHVVSDSKMRPRHRRPRMLLFVLQ